MMWKGIELDCFGMPVNPILMKGRPRLKKGGGNSKTTTNRVIPGQTPNEAYLENGLMDYAKSGLNGAGGIMSKALQSIDRQYNPSWTQLAGNYNGTMGRVSSGYNDLLAGNLPSQFAEARRKALNDDLQATVGSSVNNLAQRGVINSSVMSKALDDISEDAASQLAKSYTSDLGTYSGLLGSTASNANQILAGNQLAQQASETPTNSLFDYAAALANPAGNMYNTMYSGRMGTGSTSTTTSNGSNGIWSTIGTLGTAYILCFTGETLVTTPVGYKKIRDIQPGDMVLSLDEDNEVTPKRVASVTGGHLRDIVEVYFGDGTVWHTTARQRYYDGKHFASIDSAHHPRAVVFQGNPVEVLGVEMDTGRKELVYDLTLEGPAERNIFFANDVAAEGMGD
ncbi:Hint domain-containing protein [Mitsuokella multacida]|uniref:Hint domain-containing protein n=1 Tax=Mitsuokella multacida TaxID=52226 RepID=UPI002673B94B|nr:Hint domain-containing protein [Mitsuokella multacida]